VSRGDIQVTTPAPRESWARLLAEDPAAPPFQAPGWTESVLAVRGGRDISRHYRFADGRELVLPLVRAAHAPGRWSADASMPYGWGSGGLLGGSRAVTAEDVRLVLADLADQPPLRLTIRPPARDAAAYEQAMPAGVARTRHRDQALDLSGGFEQVWTERFTGKARRAVRKAEASALTVERDDAGRLIPEFYELYQQSVVRWAAHQHEPVRLARLRAARRDPLSKFQTVAAATAPALRVYLARLDGRPAAAILVLRHGSNASYWRGAMDKDLAGPPRANDLLHRLAIEDACVAGCVTYDMGDSGDSDSLARFKESFGAVSRTYAGYRLERLPLTAWDARARGLVKRVLGFRDV
jgi:hypothetical protein